MVKCRVYFRWAHTSGRAQWRNGERIKMELIDGAKLEKVWGASLTSHQRWWCRLGASHTQADDAIWRLFLMSLIDPLFSLAHNRFLHPRARPNTPISHVSPTMTAALPHAIHLRIRLASCACVCSRCVFSPTSNITLPLSDNSTGFELHAIRFHIRVCDDDDGSDGNHKWFDMDWNLE